MYPHVGVDSGGSIKVPLQYIETEGLESKEGIESLPQISTRPVRFFYTSGKEGYGKLDVWPRLLGEIQKLHSMVIKKSHLTCRVDVKHPVFRTGG